MYKRKYARKGVRKPYRKVKGYKKSNKKLVALIKKVMTKTQTEIKWINQRTFVDATVGQTRGLFDTGFLAVDITPTPSNGTGVNQRVGEEIHLTGAQLRLQFKHQASTAVPIRFKVYIVKTIGAPMATSAFSSQFLLQDLLSGATDYNSRRNPSYMRNFKVVCTRKVYMPGDNYGGQNTFVADRAINLKLNHNVEISNGTTIVTGGQLFALIVADNGNCDPLNSSSVAFPQVANPAVNTGALLNMDCLWYYSDK